MAELISGARTHILVGFSHILGTFPEENTYFGRLASIFVSLVAVYWVKYIKKNRMCKISVRMPVDWFNR